MDLNKLHEELEELFPKMIEIRRDLHQNPELGFEEERTPKVIADYLKDLGLEVRTEVGGHGVVGTLRGGKEGKTIALRADFDALPIQDAKDVPYKSQVPGKMHACGHDGHTAILLGVATVLSKYKDQLKGNVVFVHQHAEEVPPGGAKPMIEDGCLDGVDVIFGTHLQSLLPTGEVYYKSGYSTAAADSFEVTVYGKGGHGASPHETVDPIVTACQLVVTLQQVISRNVNPIESAVLSVGSIHSGSTMNVIPDSATFTGTVRTFKPEVRDLVEKRIEEVAKSICQASGATCEVKYERGYDSIHNTEKETEYIRKIASEVIGEENVKEALPIMAGEDFSYYLNEVPGTYFTTGARLEDESKVAPHHHPNFDFNEKAMLIAAKVFVAAIAKYNE